MDAVTVAQRMLDTAETAKVNLTIMTDLALRAKCMLPVLSDILYQPHRFPLTPHPSPEAISPLNNFKPFGVFADT